MAFTTLLLSLLLIAVLAAIALLIVLLLRKPDTLLETHGARLQQIAANRRNHDGENQKPLCQRTRSGVVFARVLPASAVPTTISPVAAQRLSVTCSFRNHTPTAVVRT